MMFISSARRFGSFQRAISQQFLSFAEARDFMKRQEITSHRDWMNFKQRRPSFIPSHPEVVYRNAGWVDMPNFLGYERRRGPAEVERIRLAAEHYRETMNDSTIVDELMQQYSRHFCSRKGADMVEKFISEVSQHVSNIEFKVVGQQYKCAFLYRIHTDDNDFCEGNTTKTPNIDDSESWIPVQMQASMAAIPRCNFSHAKVSIETGVVCISSAEETRVWMLRSGELKQGPARAYTTHLREHAKPNMNEIVDQLRLWWELIPRRSISQIAEYLAREKVRKQFVLRQQVFKMLYDDLGLRHLETPTLRPHNSLLNKYKVLERRGQHWKHPYYSSSCVRISLERVFFSQQIPLDAADEIDFLVVLTPVLNEEADFEESSRLHGSFVIPYSALGERLASPGNPGKREVRLYPPYLSPINSQSRKVQQRYLPYYHDLSTPEAVQKSQDKLRQFLLDYGPTKFAGDSENQNDEYGRDSEETDREWAISGRLAIA
jgi:hypothetical protein